MLPLSSPPFLDTHTKVSVLVVTYNHEKYIAQAIESVLMQRVNFDYEIVIIEDCSTDSTRDIVVDFQTRYPDRIRLVLAEKNKCTNEDLATAFQEAPSQYIALLDGDDYWTSSHKLQKQVDFLDVHPGFALCFHNVMAFYEDGSREPSNFNPVDQKENVTLEDLWPGNPIAGCSPMFRKDLVGEIPDWYCTDIWGDWPLYILSAQRGEVGYIDEVMGAYRIHSGGHWSSLSETRKLEELIEFYKAMDANLGFRYNETINTMISKCYAEQAVERSGMPRGVTVLVVNEGSGPLPCWEDRQTWPFPQNEGGIHADHYPANSGEAIVHFEKLRARGGGYLLFPNAAFWWLNRYKGFRQHLDTWHSRVWKDEHCIIYKLLDMPLVEVTDVSVADRDPQRLWGCHIDLPKPNTRAEASAFDIEGWVLSKSSPATAVELVHDGAVLQRVPLNRQRPDIAKAFPDVPGAEDSGFHVTTNVLGTISEFELSVRAVLEDQSRISIGAIRGRPWGEGEDERSGAALVSVIIPCFDQVRLLGEAIESVLGQNYPHFEVVVVDDGSTDNASEVAGRYPGVRCVRQENRGLSGARNTGIRRSNGEYLVFLDADHRLLPGALETGLGCFEKHPECAFVYGHYRSITAGGSLIEECLQERVEQNQYLALLKHNYIVIHATVMYRREVFDTVGVFDASLEACEDYDLYLRIARDFPIYPHGKVVAEYRPHGTNMARNPALVLKASMAVLYSQWPHVMRKSSEYKEAYEIGIRNVQEHYGEQLVREVREHAGTGEWRPMLRGVLTLLHYSPQKLTSVVRPFFAEQTEPLRLFRRLAEATERAQREAAELRHALEEQTDLQQHIHSLATEKEAMQRRIAALRQTVEEQAQRSDTLTTESERASRRENELQANVQSQPELETVAGYEILEVSKAEADPTLLRGHHIDKPEPGATTDGHRFHISGWALGKTSPAIAVELVHQREPIRRVPMNQHRPDLAAAFPHIPDAERGGFSTDASLAGMSELELGVRAVLEDQRRVPLGTVRARATQRLRKRSGEEVLILHYHRVTELPSDPWALSVTPDHFAKHLEVLREHVRLIRLQELSQGLREGNLPNRSVVVTFDDGYADNLLNAKPLLERYGVPATVFLATGLIEHEREPWWDELEQLLLQPGILPGELRLSVNGGAYEWELGEMAHYTEDAFELNRSWKAWEIAPTARHTLYRSLWGLLHAMPDGERRRVLDELLAWAGTEQVRRPTHRFLSIAEVSELAQSSLLDIGAHTVTHPALAALPASRQRDEIQRSKAKLEEVLGHRVTNFAYPYGTRSDYSPETVAIVWEAGFACACSSLEGVVEKTTDRFQLPRVHVQDWCEEEFAGLLSGWLGSP